MRIRWQLAYTDREQETISFADRSLLYLFWSKANEFSWCGRRYHEFANSIEDNPELLVVPPFQIAQFLCKVRV